VYVRVGSTNRRADRELTEELRRFARSEIFDEQPLPGLDSEALDFRAASESFAGVRKLTRRDLETLRLVTEHQGRKVPTVGGMLLFGRDRAEHFPDAWIQAGRFGGRDKSRIVDRSEIRSHPVRAIEEAVVFVAKHALHGAEIGTVRRRESWNLPPAAVREAVINAVAHADYAQRGAPIRVSIFDDRLEVENPGLLPFGLTIEDLPRGVSKLRNRVIGRVFHALGLVERWGSGVQRMTGACREMGLAPPRFEEIAVRFRVTLSTERVGRPALDETDQAIVGRRKRCQEPFPGCLRGRPRGRRVISRPRRRTMRSTHVSLPNGVPRFTQRRSAASSCSVCGSCTHSNQPRGQRIGHGLNIRRESASPCSRRHKLLQRHWSARRTSFARSAFRST
jgi:predicted HTH transcriptional regulator